MPCVCARCVQHSKTLGLTQASPTKAAMRKAFRAAAKRWHPDRFENNTRAQKDAEEHFKLVQVAYRELWDHDEHPVQPSLETAAQPPVETPFAKPKPPAPAPTIHFAGAPGCFNAPNFPPIAHPIIAHHLADPEHAIAFIDLSGPGSPPRSRSQFVLLTVDGIVVRDAHKLVSLLWYSDLGDVRITERRRYGKLNFWPRLVERLYGVRPKYALLVYRRTGSLFCAFADEMDDSVKKVVYNFLLRMKSETRR